MKNKLEDLLVKIIVFIYKHKEVMLFMLLLLFAYGVMFYNAYQNEVNGL